MTQAALVDDAGARVRPSADAIERAGLPWLFSAPLDVAVLAVPAVVTAVCFAVSASFGVPGTVARADANWIASFVLGNTTHVILTFLLLGARTDVLRAAPGQARLVVLGSIATFALWFAAFAVTGALVRGFADFATAIALVLSFHHTLSQARGVWSLYNLRARAFGCAPPSPGEQRLMRLFAPVGMLLVAVRFLFVEKAAGLEIPFFSAFVGIPGLLPHLAVWPMLGAWSLFAIAVVREILRGDCVSAPKVMYVASHLAAVALVLASPGWGVVFWASVHGLEYFALSRQMLAPRDASERSRLARVGVAALLAVAPLFVVGVLNAPFAAALGVRPLGVYTWARYALNGVVMAHYFADAFIYRFRIPSVRAVALRRLGFDG
jgi:hypothetical protein